jgi:Outer membrane protein beta-barrel domain
MKRLFVGLRIRITAAGKPGNCPQAKGVSPGMLRIGIGLGFLCFAAGIASAQLPVSAGVKGGVGLTDAFENNTFLLGDFFPEGELYIHNYSPSKDYIVGPFVELRLPFGLGVEADGLYRRLHLATITGPMGGSGTPYYERSSSWEFPILAKYRFKMPIARPYVDAGPSFRVTDGFPNTLSDHGFAAGAGVDIKALLLHISPEVRYTHWGTDAAPAPGNGGLPRSNVNQFELLAGIAF